MTQRTIRILYCDLDGCTSRYVPDVYMPPAELRVVAMRDQDWTARWDRPATGVRVRLDICGNCKSKAATR